MSELNLSDANLYYEVHEATRPSNNPPLLLVAGLASDSQSWQPALHALTQDRRIILLDNRGSGRTRAPNEITLTQMAQDCLALCDHLKIDQIDLLGHSMGGCVSLNVARMAPERIRKLIICNSTSRTGARNDMMFTDWADALDEAGATARWYRTFFYWIFTREFFNNEQALQQLVNLVMNYEYGPNAVTYRSQVNALKGFDATAWLSQITTQALVIASSEDLIFPPGDDASGLAALPNAQVDVIPGLAHSLPLEAPRVFGERVLGFLNR
ncbi:alpha/beta fold hydrolase [Orrella daihaiensis]|uniref:Alpha/beta fold hydrolase n=1 Tax=Orrella daihaiensis TaxID=2782176 RepID=A0ABY4AII7_9BURK|nr:alpha/beta fold hydrolase [Orrella daihaiensis]UOD50099.1 alpha/beta fold hydrolase [Orrella daihaiensis]